MNCNLVLANDYGRLLDDMKMLLTKSRLLLEKEAEYQFDLSLVELALSFPAMEKQTWTESFVISRERWSF